VERRPLGKAARHYALVGATAEQHLPHTAEQLLDVRVSGAFKFGEQL
jgi:hypothetical protein